MAAAIAIKKPITGESGRRVGSRDRLLVGGNPNVNCGAFLHDRPQRAVSIMPKQQRKMRH
jgi:hypothetical protein